MAESVVRENDTIAGKYLIGRTLGEGGMGVVVAARHLELDQMVAIKFLRPEIAGEGASAERFRREARAAVKIRSEHVCRVLDVGALGTGVPYLVMEYLEGCDLADEAQRRGRLPVDEAVDYVLQACEALAEAHASGIVHRDLKPGNLFLEVRRDGSRGIKVLDFGVSKSLVESAGQLRLTKTASLVGSPLYMSPEQLDAAKDVDPRADIWALGTILFELVAGRTPFYAETIPQLVHAVMTSSPPSFAELGVSVAPEFEKATLAALVKARDARYGSVSAFARAIAPFGPPHGMISVLRTERVLSSSNDGPSRDLASAPIATGQTPANLEKRGDTVATRTLDVSGKPEPPQGVTPATWGTTSAREGGSRRLGLVGIGAMLALGIGALAFGMLRKEPVAPVTPAAGTPSEPAARSPDPAPRARETAVAAPAVPIPSVASPAPSSSSVNSAPAVTAEGKASPATGKAGPRAAPERPSPSPAPKAKAASEGISDFGGRR